MQELARQEKLNRELRRAQAQIERLSQKPARAGAAPPAAPAPPPIAAIGHARAVKGPAHVGLAEALAARRARSVTPAAIASLEAASEQRPRGRTVVGERYRCPRDDYAVAEWLNAEAAGVELRAPGALKRIFAANPHVKVPLPWACPERSYLPHLRSHRRQRVSRCAARVSRVREPFP